MESTNEARAASGAGAALVHANDFLVIPLKVDMWLTGCLHESSHISISRNGAFCELDLQRQVRCFENGYMVWRLLHHYFPRDLNLSAYRKPQTRRQYAEVWNQVDLVLRKHRLPMLPQEAVKSVLRQEQVNWL